MATAQSDIGIRITAKDEASGVLSTVGSKLGVLKNAVSVAAGMAGFAGLQSVVSSTIGLLKESVKEFGAQEQAVARLSYGLKNVTGSTRENVMALIDQANALQRVTTFADEQIISAQGQLATFQLNSDAISQLTPRILDMAAGLEKSTGSTVDLEQISIALGKALGPDGSAGALARYGVSLTETQKELFNNSDAAGKLSVMLEALDMNYKGIAEGSAQTFTGRLRNMQNQISDLKENVGGFVTLAMASMVQSFVDASGGMQNFGNVAVQVGKNVAFIMLYTANAVAFLTGKIAYLVQAFKGLMDATGPEDKSKQHEGAFGKILDIPDNIMNMFNSVSSSLQSAKSVNDASNKFIDENMKAINSISGMNGVDSQIPQFANGGIVPGANGSPRLIMAHGGETVLPTHKNVTVNLGGITINNEVDSNNFFNKLSNILGGNIENAKLGVR